MSRLREASRHDRFDAVVIGAGHNGLVAAAYLARSGQRVAVVEARPLVGGACATEELIPGFRFSSAAVVLSLLWPKIIRELELKRYGLSYYHTAVDRVGIWENGRVLVLEPELDRQLAALASFSRHDAVGLLRLGAEVRRFAALYEATVLRPPPSFDAFRTLFRGSDRRIFERIVLGSIRGLLEPYFETPELLGFHAFPGMVSVDAGPDTPGTAYSYGHHAVGGLDGKLGSHGFVHGGMGGITQALARSAEAAGSIILTGTPVSSVLVEDGAAAGLRLADGRELHAAVVVSNADPHRTLLGLVGEHQLEPGFAAALAAFDRSGTMARVYLAVSELPRYEAAPHDGREPAPVHRAFALLGTDLERFARAHQQQQAGVIPSDPVLELSIQTTDDPSLAPPGLHTLILGVMHTPWTLASGSWDDERERFGDAVVEQLCRFAPNVRDAIVGRVVATPLDLERTFGLPRGNIFHGAMTTAQLFGSRPLPGWSSYRMPIRGLYLCGSGTHPGGAVSGAPGHNAAQEAIADLRDGAFGPDEWLARARRQGVLPPTPRRGRALARAFAVPGLPQAAYALARRPALQALVRHVLTTGAGDRRGADVT